MPEDLPAPAHTSNPPSMLGLYLAIALLISTVALSGWMGREGTALKVAAAPQGVLSLELPASPEEARAIVDA